MTLPNPPQGTTVPVAVAAINAGLATVDFGTPAQLLPYLPPQWPRTDAICIAASNGDAPGIRHTLFPEGRYGVYNEEFDIICVLWSFAADKADDDMQARLDRCGVMFSAVKAWLDANPELAATGRNYGVTLAPVEQPWVPKNRGDGAECTVGFTIRVTATI